MLNSVNRWTVWFLAAATTGVLAPAAWADKAEPVAAPVPQERVLKVAAGDGGSLKVDFDRSGVAYVRVGPRPFMDPEQEATCMDWGVTLNQTLSGIFAAEEAGDPAAVRALLETLDEVVYGIGQAACVIM